MAWTRLAIVNLSVLAFAGSAGYLAPETRHFDKGKNKQKGKNMLGKMKKIFFGGIFCALYISFIAQFVYVLGWISMDDGKLMFLAALALEWLILIAARYLSRRSGVAQQKPGFGGGRRH